MVRVVVEWAPSESFPGAKQRGPAGADIEMPQELRVSQPGISGSVVSSPVRSSVGLFKNEFRTL